MAESPQTPQGVPVFGCELRHEGEVVRIVPSGELDVASAVVLEQHIDEALSGGANRLVLDLGALTFMASTGLRMVLRLVEQSDSDPGFELGVVRGPRQVQRVFELTRTDDRVPWVDG
jgi:anti-anti-sigma factor